MMKLVVIIALAVCLVPREAVLRVAHSTYATGVDIVTLCDRRPVDCRDIADQVNQAGAVLADFSLRAAVELQGLFENSFERARQFRAVSAVDRGTLIEEDLTPDWRGL